MSSVTPLPSAYTASGSSNEYRLGCFPKDIWGANLFLLHYANELVILECPYSGTILTQDWIHHSRFARKPHDTIQLIPIVDMSATAG